MTAFKTSVTRYMICLFVVYKKTIGYWFLVSIIFRFSSIRMDFTQYLINIQLEGDSQKLCSFVMKSKHQFNPPFPLL